MYDVKFPILPMYHGGQSLQLCVRAMARSLRDGGKGIRHGAEKSLARDLGDVAERIGAGCAGADADVPADAAVWTDAAGLLWPTDAGLRPADADDALLWSHGAAAAGISAGRSLSDAANSARADGARDACVLRCKARCG